MDDTYLCDLGQCEPASAVSVDAAPGVWRALEYETHELSGTMLLAGDETGAPEITYRLNRKGWHRLSVGLCPSLGPSTVQVRLSDEDAFSMLRFDPTATGGKAGHGDELHELHWKDTDVTGQDVVLSQISLALDSEQPRGPLQCQKAAVAFIRAVPLSDDEVAAIWKEREQTETKRLYAHNDAHGYVFLFGPSTKEEVWRELEPYRNSDFSRIYWECGMGDLLYYLGERGRSCACDTVREFYRQGDRVHAQAWRGFREAGLDPFRVARDYAVEIGLEFHAAYRPAGFFFPPPYDHWNVGGLYGRRPDLRSTGKDGSPAPRLSYTYPEVRRFAVDLLLEVAEIGVDGICVLYNRRPPLVDYDPPLVEAFEREHGEDPRKLPEDDERWLDVKSRPLTEFMRELREATRERRMPISVCVSNRRENRLHGMDIARWIEDGLVDTLIPYTSAVGLDSSAESWPGMVEVDYFVELTRGTSCDLSMSVLPRHMSPEEYRSKAAALYEKGVESLFFWDSAGGCGRANFSPAWREVCRLGNREEVLSWHAGGEPPISRRPLAVTGLGGYDLSYQTPG